MKKRIICTLMAIVLCQSTGMTALAAPETMPDGGVFDAKYYAETYPDVKAAFGDNKEALYNHYLNFGKAEGRSPYSPEYVPTQESVSVKEKVAALGITYDPNRDAELKDNTVRDYPFVDNWHVWSEWQKWHSFVHFQRADYTNDPLYYEFAKELVKKHDERLAKINELKAIGAYDPGDFPYDFRIVVNDNFAGYDLTVLEREYLFNLLSNLVVDYVESILGTDMLCHPLGDVYDWREIGMENPKITIFLYPNTGRPGYLER